jgi:hypothetical protein
MQSSRDSSLLRSLAVAFGDGLAFVAGMKLTEAAGRQLSASRPSAPPRSGVRSIEQIEPSHVAGSDPVDQKVLETIVKAIEERLAVHSGQVEHRMAGLEARLAIELESLDRQDQAIVKRVSDDIKRVFDDIGALREHVVRLHREFAETVAQIVEEQVGSQVQARAAALEQRIAARIAAAVEIAVGVAAQAAIDSRLPAVMSAIVAPLEEQIRAEVEQKDREIAELRQRLADTDTKVSELILGIGQICRQAAGKMAPPVDPAERGSAHWQSASPTVNTVPGAPAGGAGEVPQSPDVQEDGDAPESQYDRPVPGVAKAQRPNRLWRVPMVSSVIIATSGLALRHFL